MEAQKTNASDGMLKSTTSSGKETEKDQVNNDGNIAEPARDEIYEPVERLGVPPMDEGGYLLPRPEQQQKTVRTRDNGVPSNNPSDLNNQAKQPKTSQTLNLQHGRQVREISRGVISMYEDLWSFKKDAKPLPTDDEGNKYQSLAMKNPSEDEPIYDEVDTLIPSNMCGAKIIPNIEEPASAYDEVVINDSRYLIPNRTWDSDSDACDSDFDDEGAPNYFGDNLGELYEAIEKRKIAPPMPRTVSFANYEDMSQKPKTRAGLQEALRGCLPISFTKNQQKTVQKTSDDDDTPLYVDPNTVGATEPVMPPISMDLSVDEVLRYEIVNKILVSEATYKEQLNELIQIEEDVRERGLLEPEKLDEIFCSLQDILQCHEMFSMVLAARMKEWTVGDKLGDLICASVS